MMLEKLKDWIHGIIIASGAILGEMISWEWQTLVWITTVVYGILQIIYITKKIRAFDKHDTDKEKADDS